MTRTTVQSGDATLSVLVEGDAGKPWLLVSNSLAADLRMWDDQLPLFTRTHRVIRYDTRGHGESSAPEEPYDFPMLVADAVAILDRLGVERADVVGLSLGGMTALGLGLAHPGRVGQMVVCDARADAPPAFAASWDDRIAAVASGGMAAVVEGTLGRWFSEECDPAVRARAGEMILATSPVGYAGCARALQGLAYLEHLPELRPQVLYVVGGEDAGAPPDVMAAMAEATPHAEFVVLPGLAHIVNMEDPAGFAETVGPWLAEAARERAA